MIIGFYISLAVFAAATIAYFITSAPLAPLIEHQSDQDKKTARRSGT